jgi:hypothetical protein
MTLEIFYRIILLSLLERLILTSVVPLPLHFVLLPINDLTHTPCGHETGVPMLVKVNATRRKAPKMVD